MDEVLESALPTAMITRVAAAVQALAMDDNAEQTLITATDTSFEHRAVQALASIETAFDDKFMTWCVVQGGAWLRAAMALHWQVRIERALLQRHFELEHDGSRDAVNVMVESVSRAAVDLLTTSVVGLCPSSRTSALTMCKVVLETATHTA